MQNVNEVQRHPSPGARPQPLAFYNGHLWVGAWETEKLYAIDPQSWSVAQEVTPPGKPFGLAVFDGALCAVVALADDDRYLVRYTADRGFSEPQACPDFTGSHLASDGKTLYLCQQGKHRILALAADGSVAREIALPTRCAGFAFGAASESYIISADEEFENLTFGTIDLGESNPAVTTIAKVPIDARGLTFDGALWWTSHRDASEIVAFSV